MSDAEMIPDLHAVAIERARTDQLDDLAELAIATFRDTFGEFNTTEDQRAFIVEHLTADVWRRKLADESHDVSVAVHDRSLVAYFVVVHDSPNAAVEATSPAELSKLYVDRSMHRRGLGRRLLDEVIERCRRAHHDVLWLSVWEHNERAKAFYRTYPFRKVGTWEYPVGEKIDIDEIWVLDL